MMTNSSKVLQKCVALSSFELYGFCCVDDETNRYLLHYHVWPLLVSLGAFLVFGKLQSNLFEAFRQNLGPTNKPFKSGKRWERSSANGISSFRNWACWIVAHSSLLPGRPVCFVVPDRLWDGTRSLSRPPRLMRFWKGWFCEGLRISIHHFCSQNKTLSPPFVLMARFVSLSLSIENSR